MNFSMICRFDNSGLGTLSWEFARHLKPKRILLVQNGVFQTFPERYSEFETRKVPATSTISQEDMDWLLDEVDILFSIETFYNWHIISACRKKGVKSVLYTMFEMCPWPIPLMPDMLLCPSKLDYEIFKDFSTRVEYIPVPVATDRLIWQERKEARTFIHSASHGGMAGRKGTQLLLDAIPQVKSDVQFVIHSWQPFKSADERVTVNVANFKNYWQMWRGGDVLVYPQGANGICLPIIEAMSSGLGVITTDIYPFNEYMPKELLFKTTKTFKRRMSPRLMEVQDYEIDPKDIAEKIDEIANTSIDKHSRYGLQWSKENSWDSLLPRYKSLFNTL